MLQDMELWTTIRRALLVDNMSKRSAAEHFGLERIPNWSGVVSQKLLFLAMFIFSYLFKEEFMPNDGLWERLLLTTLQIARIGKNGR